MTITKVLIARWSAFGASAQAVGDGRPEKVAHCVGDVDKGALFPKI